MRKLFSISVFLSFLFILYPQVLAEVPQMINYQGKLTTAEGGCLNDTVSMTFTIYSDDQGTVIDWTEDQDSVIVKEGIFNVFLGSTNPIPDTVFDGSVKYLGVQVESDPEMRPLKPMVSVAYAYKADTDGDWAINGDTIYYLDGKVGIGTASPNPLSKLHIEENFPNPNRFLLYIKNTATADFAHNIIRVICSSTSNRCQPGIQFIRPSGTTWEISQGAGDFTSDFLGFFRIGLGNVMVLDTSGNVGIGTTNAGNILTIKQNSTTDPIADAWTTYSSKEYKRNIHEFTPEEYRKALKKVVSVPVVKFHYKGEDTKEKIGIIAEDAPKQILAEGDNKAISLNEYISLLHAALKAQQEQIAALKGEMEKIKSGGQ